MSVRANIRRGDYAGQLVSDGRVSPDTPQAQIVQKVYLSKFHVNRAMQRVHSIEDVYAPRGDADAHNVLVGDLLFQHNDSSIPKPKKLPNDVETEVFSAANNQLRRTPMSFVGVALTDMILSGEKQDVKSTAVLSGVGTTLNTGHLPIKMGDKVIWADPLIMDVGLDGKSDFRPGMKMKGYPSTRYSFATLPYTEFDFWQQADYMVDLVREDYSDKVYERKKKHILEKWGVTTNFSRAFKGSGADDDNTALAVIDAIEGGDVYELLDALKRHHQETTSRIIGTSLRTVESGKTLYLLLGHAKS